MSAEVSDQGSELRSLLDGLIRKVQGLPQAAQEPLLADIARIERCLQAPDRTSSALQAGEEDHFSILANNIPQLAWMADASGWIFWYNQRWYDYTGAAFEEMQGWGWQSVHHPDTVAQVVEKFRYHIQHGQAWEDTFPLRRSDGVYRWFLSRAMPIQDRCGKVVRWFGTNTDVTEQRLIEQSLRANERRFRLALNAAPISVFSTDRDLRYTWLYKGRFGLTVEQMLGKRDDELNPENDISELVRIKRLVIETGKGVQQEVRARINGEEVVYFDNLEPIVDAAGKVAGLTGAAFDLTQQRRLEAENRQVVMQMEIQHHLLEHRERIRQRIAREIHDGPIQTLVSVLFQMQAMRGEMQGPQALDHHGEITNGLKQAVQELRDMVSELRPPELVHLGLRRAILLHAQDFRQKHPEIDLSVDAGPVGEDDLSEEVCLALYRICQEALNNVARHAQAGRVWITLRRQSGQILLEVRDNGMGFVVPANWVDLTRHNHFGMAGIRERVAAVQGKIDVISRPGQGVTLRVRVPPGGSPAE